MLGDLKGGRQREAAAEGTHKLTKSQHFGSS